MLNENLVVNIFIQPILSFSMTRSMKKSEKNHASVRKFNKHFLLIF